jgi:predicted KAP-like P-loop ATPase
VVKQAPVFADSFTISSMDLSNSGKDGKPATLGEVMKQVMAKYKVKLEASANQKTRQTTFHVRAETQKELDKAKRSLLALLSPVVRCFPSQFPNLCLIFATQITLTINAPASTIASIIGPKGELVGPLPVI